MSALSYLEQYRQRYTPITSQEKLPVSNPTANVQSLLTRYLGPGEILTVGVTDSSNGKLETLHESPQSSKEEIIDKTCSNPDVSDSDDDIFDDLDKSLLPTSVFNSKPKLTVNEVIQKDAKLAAMYKVNGKRRHSSPNDGSNTLHQYQRHLRRRASSSPEGSGRLQDISAKASIARPESEICLKTLGRQDSNLSTVSFESNMSNKSINASYNDDILELSDGEFDFDLEIDLNSSKQSDSDSQKLFSQFQLDSDSQKDVDSLTGNDDADGGCLLCHPLSARSACSADSNISLCHKCAAQRRERHATIKEILESELSYQKDLKLIKDHFHDPLTQSGLLSEDEISVVFGNILRLISVSEKFADQLVEHLKCLRSSGDEYYSEAAIGQLICDSSAKFLAFETYCLNYTTAATTIEQLRKDNELFNLFLDASQNDNAALRRMDLKTFLMLPVQRVMKYPLLMKRLYKATNTAHTDRDAIEGANEKLTNILHHINAQSKLLSSLISNPKGSNSKSTQRTSFEIALTKLVIDTLNWKYDEVHFLNSGKVGYLQPGDSQLKEKIRTSRFNIAYAVLVTRGRDNPPKSATKKHLLFTHSTAISNAALLIIKKGTSRLQVLGEPYYLPKCLVSRNAEYYDVFEIAKEYFKEKFIVRPTHSREVWFKNLKYYSMVLGGRNNRRRHALPNILLHT